MSETIYHEQKQSLLNEQIERFFVIFSDLRKVMGVGFKHAHQQGLETHQQFIARVRAIFLAMSAEGRTSLLSGLEEFIQVGLEIQEAPVEPIP